MVIWICDNCGLEIELPEGTEPIVCPECEGIVFRLKPPAPPGGSKIGD